MTFLSGMAAIGQEQSVTSPKSRTFERLILFCKRPLVVWASMAISRPKLPLVLLNANGRYGLLTGRRPEIVPNDCLLISYPAAPDTEATVAKIALPQLAG